MSILFRSPRGDGKPSEPADRGWTGRLGGVQVYVAKDAVAREAGVPYPTFRNFRSERRLSGLG